jgi:hypothetical protein
MIEIDDRVFGGLFLFLGISFAITKTIDNYGYNKLISQLKIVILIITSIGILILTIIFIIKKLVEKRKEAQQRKADIERIKNRKAKQELPIEETEELKRNIENTTDESSTETDEEEQTEMEDMNIELGEDVVFYRLKSLNEHEIYYLKNRDFIIRTRFNPFNNRKEEYIFKKNDNESEQHFLVTRFIFNYLKKRIENVKTFETVKPDIVFEINSKKFAIEIETGKIINHNKANLITKIKTLNQEYEGWFFVVTNRNLVSKYRKYGKVMDTRYIKNQLDKFIENQTLNQNQNTTIKK